MILGKPRPRPLIVTLRCQRVGCGTRVKMVGDDGDPILTQVARWGSTCPKCHGDLDVISRVTLPFRVMA